MHWVDNPVARSAKNISARSNSWQLGGGTEYEGVA